MKVWITKRIVEVLEEEEKTLIDFVCKKLKEHTAPEEILKQLVVVFEEEEATVFVVKLWRFLIWSINFAKNS